MFDYWRATWIFIIFFQNKFIKWKKNFSVLVFAYVRPKLICKLTNSRFILLFKFSSKYFFVNTKKILFYLGCLDVYNNNKKIDFESTNWLAK